MSVMLQHRNMAYAEISVFAHATEDPEKVEKAVRNLVPVLRRDVQLALSEMRGHHGNPILRFEAELTIRKEALEALHVLPP